MEVLESRTVPALIAYEPFNYYVPSNAVNSAVVDPAAVTLLGQGPGAGDTSSVGLTGTWSNDGTGSDWVVAGSIGYPTYANYQSSQGAQIPNYDGAVPTAVAPVGNSIMNPLIRNNSAFMQNEVSLATPFGSSTGTDYWVSFLMKPLFGSSGHGDALVLVSNNANHDTINIGYNSAKNLVAGKADVMGSAGTGITFNQTLGVFPQNSGGPVLHLVAKIRFVAGSNTTATLYLNPGFGSAPQGSVVTTADLGADFGDIVAIGASRANRSWIDEVRIASTYQDLWSDPAAQGATAAPATSANDPRYNGIRVPDVADATRNGPNNQTVNPTNVYQFGVVALGTGESGAGLFKFSDGSATGLSNTVPAGFNVASAKVILTSIYPQPYAGATPIETSAYNITSSWDDNSANPNPAVDTNVLVATGSGTAANGRYTYDVTGLAQQWLTGAVANHGIAIAQTGSANLNFFSREATLASSSGYTLANGDRPVLVLTLTRNSGIGISSNGGGSAASATGSVDVPANTTAVTTVTVDNPTGQSLTFDALTGPDAGLFSISSGGVLTFNSAPSTPALYSVTVNVSGTGGSGNTTASQTLAVRVTPQAAPTLNAIANVTVPQNAGAQTVTLSGIGSPGASTAGIISVNFTNNAGGSTLTSGQTPGLIPVGNWNNKSAGAAAAVNDSSGAATGVTVAYTGGTSDNTSTSWFGVPAASTSTANNALMSAGVPNGNTITLSNLNAQYPNGYDVYVYLAPQYTYSNGKGVVSDGTTSLSYDVSAAPFTGFQQSTGFNVVGNYVVFTNKTADTLALTNTVSGNGWNVGGFQTTYVTGMQIVPRATPKPLSFTTTSSNPALIPQASVSYTSGSSTASLSYTPTAGMSGTSTITVVVSDGNYVIEKSFVVSVAAPSLIAYEPFNYYVPSNAVSTPVVDPAAVSLLGQGPGAGNTSTVGLTGTWTNDGVSSDWVVAGSVGYPTYANYQSAQGAQIPNYDGAVPSIVAPVGNSIVNPFIRNNSAFMQNDVSLATPFGSSTGTEYWVSFLMKPLFGTSGHGESLVLVSDNANHDTINIGFNSARNLVAGKADIMNSAGTGITFNQTIGVFPQNSGGPVLHLVAKLDFGVGSNTTATLYLNPGFGTAPQGSIVTTADLGADFGDIVAIGASRANRSWFDEIRISSTYQGLWSDPAAQGATTALAAAADDPRYNGLRVPDVADATRNGANNQTVNPTNVYQLGVVAIGSGESGAGLFKFSDGSSSGLSNTVPAGFGIASAKVVLTGLYPQPYAGTTPIATTAYNITSSWNDSAANPNPSVDTGTSVATGTGTAANGRYTYDITSLAQQWLLATVANNGIAIVQTGSANLSFFSREATLASSSGYTLMNGDRPVLVLSLTRNSGIGISSNGGGSAASATGSVSVPAGTTAVTTVTVDNPTGQSLTFDALTGTDAGLFSISSGGVLTFNAAPSTPALYSVTVNVSGTGGSGNTTASQTLAVRVTPAGVPTLYPIADVTVDQNVPTQTITLSGISSPNASTAGVISVNFTNNATGSTLTGTQTPGIITAANWNNKSAGAAAAVNDSSGTATGVTVAYTGGTNDNTSTSWFGVPVASTSTANNALMSAGVPNGNTITVANLNAQYPNGYDVYVYLAPQYTYSNGKGTVSDGTTSLDYNVSAAPFTGFQLSTGYNVAGNYVVFTNKTADTLALTNSVSGNGWNVNGFQTTYVTGIQVVPRGASRPLAFTTTSSNTALIPQAAVTYSPGSGTATLAYTPTTNASGTSTITVNVSDGNYVTTESFVVTVVASVAPPTLDAIADETIDQESSQQTVDLTGIGDGHGGADTLVVTATSDNQALIANANVVVDYVSPNSTGTLQYTPTALQFGTANITVKVKNETNGQEFTRTFLVTVEHIDHVPTINALADVSTYLDPGLLTVNLSGISPGLGGDTGTVTVTAVSDNHAVIPDPDVSYVPGSSTGSISFTPVAGQLGVAQVTVTVDDGALQTQRVFTVTISPRYTHLSPISDVNFNEDTSANIVNFGGISVDGVVAPPPRVVSLNIYDSGNTLSSGSFAGAYSASNWNNVPVTANGTYGGTVVTNEGTNTSIGVQMSGSLPNSTELVSGTSPSAVMMTGSGLRSIYDLGTINYYAQVQLSNLASLFGDAGGGATTSHYDVYVYYGNGYNGHPTLGNFMGGSGNMVLSSDGFTDATTADYPTAQTANILASQGYATILGNRAGFPESGYTYSDTGYTNGINGTGFIQSQGSSALERGNYVKLTDLSSDNLVITPVVNVAGYAWNTCVILGIQIVEIPVGTAPVTVTATSSDPTLVPDPTVLYVSPNSGGSLSITPVANKHGIATITVTASSPNTTPTVRTFDVTVDDVNDAPTLSPIADAVVNEDAVGPHVVSLAGISPGPFETGSVTVTATSDNQALLPDANLAVNYTSPATTGTLTFTTTANRYGNANVTVTVNDGGLTAIRTFKITVNEVNDTPTLDSISNLNVPADSGPHVVDLTGITAGPFEPAVGYQKVISINVSTNTTTNALGINDVAGVVAVDHWNNVGASYGGTPFAGTIVDKTGTSTTVGVRMSGATPNGEERVSGTSPNAVMMTGQGPRSFINADNNNNDYAQIELSNLLSYFGDSTFDVYVYYGVGYFGLVDGPSNDGFMGGSGTMILSSGGYTNNTKDLPATGILQTIDYATMRGTRSGLTDRGYTYSDTTYTTGGGSGFVQASGQGNGHQSNYLKFTNVSNDTIVVTPNAVWMNGVQWNTCSILGIQIVGHNIPQTMSVTASSDNPTLLPNPTVNYTAPDGSGSLSVAPNPGQSGTANVIVTVSDGGLTTQRQFQVTVTAAAPVVSSVTPFVGPTAGGNTVVIKGQNFSLIDPGHLADAVKFGTGTTFANATSYTVNSNTQITAVAPAGTDATTVNIVVTSSSGSSADDGVSGATGTTANDYSYATPAIASVLANGTTMQTLTSPGWSSGATTITVDSTANLVVGSQLSSLGAGFPRNATIASIPTATTFVLSLPTTAAHGSSTTIRALPLPLAAGFRPYGGAQWVVDDFVIDNRTIFVDSTSGLRVGQFVRSASTGFPTGAVITDIIDSQSFHIDKPTTINQFDQVMIEVADHAAARDRFGNLANLAGQASVVQHLLVTFNMRVVLDANGDGTSAAFNVETLAPATALGAAPSTAGSLAVTAVGVPGTGDAVNGYTQYAVNFLSGAGVNVFSNATTGAGNGFTTLHDGYYQLNTVGANVHAGQSTSADRSDGFWALYGASNVGDVKINGAIGGGDDTLLVDGLALNDIYATFGSRSDLPAGPPAYNTPFDWNLDGNVDGVDLTHLYSNFGTVWKF